MTKRDPLLALALPLVLAAALAAPAPGGALAQSRATVRRDTLADGGILFIREEPSQVELTDEEKISSLNQRVLRDPRDAKAWNDLGVLLAAQENYEAARDAFIHAVQADPKNGDYHRNLATVFSRLDMHELAVAEYGEYRKHDKLGGRDYWRLIGNAQHRAGLTDDARRTYEEGLATAADQPGPEAFRLVLALYKMEEESENEQARRDVLEKYAPAARAFVQQQAGQASPEAVDGFREAQAIAQLRIVMLVEDAKLMEESGLDEEAAVRYRTAYEQAPERDDLLPRLVDVYLRLGRPLDAGVAARLAREAHPEKAGTWIATGKVYEQANRLDDAVASYEKAFAIEPLDDLRVAIGNLHMRLGNDSKASEWLRAGVDAGDTKPEVVYNYAVSLIREKKYHAAIPSLRAVVKQRPEMHQAWLALAQCLQATDQYDGAVEPFERALALQPDAKLAFHLGAATQKSKQYDKAIAAYRQALELDPSYAKARYNLSLTYMDAGRYEDAAASFEDLVKLEGPSYRAYYSQGLAFYYLGRYQEALESYDMAMDDRKTSNLLNNIGLVYDKLGDKKQAAAWYQQAKDLKKRG